MPKEQGYTDCKFWDVDGAQGYGLAKDDYIVSSVSVAQSQKKSQML